MSDNSRRMILKTFKCPSCSKVFKKLVQFNESIAKCQDCFYEQCKENQTISSEQEEKNIQNNNNINNNNNNRQNNFIFLGASSGGDGNNNIRVFAFGRRTPNSNNEEESNINDSINNIPDILSNIFDSLSIVFINNRISFEQEKNPPLSENIIEKLTHFKMDKKFCKKNKQNNFEFPKCSICLMEINEGMESILLPCAHIFHEKCITQWLKIHNTCPLCRYELSNNN